MQVNLAFSIGYGLIVDRKYILSYKKKYEIKFFHFKTSSREN